MDYNTFANNIKQKYPQYKDEDNLELAKKVVERYPIYQKQVDIPKQGYISRVGEQIQKGAEDVKGAITTGAEMISEGQKQGGLKGILKQATGMIKSGLGTAGGVARTAIAPITEAPVIKQGIEAIGKTVAPTIQSGLETDTGKKLIAFAQQHPEAFKSLQDIVDISTLGLGGTAVKPLQKAGSVAVGATEKVIPAVGKVISPVVDTAENVVKTTGSVLKMAGKGLTNIPSRVATNVAEKKAVEQTIKTLPTKTAQQAVKEGIDINDIKFFTDLPKAQKTPVKKLVQAVQNFESGKSKLDPIEAVGKPLIDRISTVKTLQGKIGKQLGDVADTLGEIKPDEAFIPVYDSLRKVRGLEGLRIADDGVSLDFKDTVLASAETASDRNAIQSIFNEAVKDGTGKQKHLLRQELRESLGGKKAGGVQLTGTQENAYEAIRKGLSNLLDTKNPQYKKLNAQYQQVSEPLSKLSKALKIGKETDDEILNMKAGLLARRLTSNAMSNPEIKSMLNAIDKVTAKKGVTRTSLETLQDSLNILNKYYDIAPKTGFQNLVTEGVGKAGVKDFITGTIGDIAGKTNATRKKALENALKDLLN